MAIDLAIQGRRLQHRAGRKRAGRKRPRGQGESFGGGVVEDQTEEVEDGRSQSV